MTVWRARDLGCVVLKGTFEFEDDGGRITGGTDATADTIRPGEPPPELFTIPKGFKNVTPSERVQGNPLNASHEVPFSIRAQDDLFAKFRAPLN